jgi:hypothetical protein
MSGSRETGRYAAIIGDIRGSRELENRAAVQERLVSALERLNGDLGTTLAAGFVVTLGDEFQGLARGAEGIVDILNRLESELGDIPLRFAVGWGEVSTAIRGVAVGIDGPCFHAARAAMDRGKKDGRWVTFSGFGDLEDTVLNALYWLMGGVRAGWTDIQAETVEAARSARTQVQVAAERGRHTSTVSKALKSALYEPVIEAENAARALLERVDSRASEVDA